MPATRVEIADHIADAFGHGPVGRDDLIAAALRSGARPEVIDTLRRLPPGPFREMRQLWPALPGVPIEPDPVPAPDGALPR